VKKVGSVTYQALKRTGNNAKTGAGEVMGIHKVGGTVGHAVRSVSHAGKSVARSAKHTVKSSKASVYHGLQRAGDSTKAAIRKPS
jgi:hypothetical protein